MLSMLRGLWRSSAIIACGFVMTGCAGYDVELNGGIFDALGVSQIGKKKVEPKMTQRAGIVVPPRTAALPAPGSRPAPQQVASSGGLQWPVGPEDTKAQKQLALKQKHDAFCAEQRRRHGSDSSAILENGPLGSCHESILKNIGITSDMIFQNKPQNKPAQ